MALLSDEAHIKIENEIAADRRAITRLEARVSLLKDDLPRVLTAKAAAQAAAKDEALRKRAKACQKANAVESNKLLTEFDKLASQMGDILARLNEVADETNSVNKALRENRVADSVVSYDVLFLASGRSLRVPVFRDGDPRCFLQRSRSLAPVVSGLEVVLVSPATSSALPRRQSLRTISDHMK